MTQRAGKVSVYLAGKWLDEFVAGTIPTYMALFTSDPMAAGSPLSVEISSAGYSRCVGVWARTQRLLSNKNVLLWNAIQAGTNVTHIGAFDNVTGGNFLCSGPVPVSLLSPAGYYAYPSGGYLEIAAGAYHLGIDA